MDETEIRFLGVAAFEITTSKNLKIVIDPFFEHKYCPIKTEDLEKVDLVLVTHAALDHLGKTDEIARKFNAPVICGREVSYYLQERGVPASQIKTLLTGMATKIRGIIVRAFESKHQSMVEMKDGRIVTGTPFNYIVDVDPGVRIFISGDTALTSDLKIVGAINRPNIGFLNASFPRALEVELFNRPDFLMGYMSPYEAALAAQWLGLEYVIPTHFDDFELAKPDLHRFVESLKTIRDEPVVKPVILKPGETFKYRIKR